MKIVERMFQIMERKGIKQNKIAKELNIGEASVSAWKTRKTNPPVEYILNICKVLDVSVYYLLTGEEYNNSDLVTDEEALLKNYRDCSEGHKEQLNYAAQTFAASDRMERLLPELPEGTGEKSS